MGEDSFLYWAYKNDVKVIVPGIVDGAVGMVQLALERLTDDNILELDEERRAAMVSNLLVVLCGDRHAQPVINTGSLYQ